MIPEAAIAELSVLSIGDGDMRFSFNSEDPQEVARAQRVVEDMLRRGYSIFVEVDGKLTKAKGFDAETNSYIIADGPLYASAADATPSEPVAEAEPEALPNRGRGHPRKVSAKTHNATGVAPRAGG